MNLFALARSSVMALIYPFYLLLMSAITLILSILTNHRTDEACLTFWGDFSCRVFGVFVRVEGLENIGDGGGLFLFNHTSFFDIFAMAAKIPRIRFGAKIELFKVPLFGSAMRQLRMLPIDRGNRERVFSVYRAAQSRLQNGERFALAPEGTRGEEGKLGHFKAGPFIFAINTGANIFPVVIIGAGAILPKHHLIPNSNQWRREVVMKILPPISAQGYTIDQRGILQEKVRERMLPEFT